jgi:hypothetical protein
LEVDRIESKESYSPENCVLACYPCNNAKSDVFAYAEFMKIGSIIGKVKNHGENKIRTVNMEKSFEQTAKELAKEITRLTGTAVEARKTTTGAMLLKATFIFAYIFTRRGGSVIQVETLKEWSDKAGVTDSSDRQTKNGWWSHPDVWWDIETSNSKKMAKMGAILAKVCKVRHN